MSERKAKIKIRDLVPIFADIGAATIRRSVTSPFVRSKGGARSYRRDVLFSSFREILSGFNTEQGQYFTAGTSDVYRRVAKSKRWKEHTVSLDDGAQGHWLGESNAKFVMIYFHGGGYISPATPGHMKYQFGLQKYLSNQGLDLSIFSLSYTLAPEAVYPTQLKQAVSALRHLIEVENRDPNTILLGGDSAGGNLATALLLHLAHPQHQVPKLSMTKPLRAALLISPWISFETSSASFTSNAYSDYLTITALNRASTTFIGPNHEHDQYSEPIRAPVDWWTDVADEVVSEILVWGGGGEVLIDGIRSFGERIRDGFEKARSKSLEEDRKQEIGIDEKIVSDGLDKVAGGRDRVRVVISPREAHEEMIMDHILLIRKRGHGAAEIENWLTEMLTT